MATTTWEYITELQNEISVVLKPYISGLEYEISGVLQPYIAVLESNIASTSGYASGLEHLISGTLKPYIATLEAQVVALSGYADRLLTEIGYRAAAESADVSTPLGEISANFYTHPEVVRQAFKEYFIATEGETDRVKQGIETHLFSTVNTDYTFSSLGSVISGTAYSLSGTPWTNRVSGIDVVNP
jgi:hypothetical protein